MLATRILTGDSRYRGDWQFPRKEGREHRRSYKAYHFRMLKGGRVVHRLLTFRFCSHAPAELFSPLGVLKDFDSGAFCCGRVTKNMTKRSG